MSLWMFVSVHLILHLWFYFCFCHSIFLPSLLLDSYPASDDTSILSVIPPTTAATGRWQQYSSELHSTTDTDWSSAATGDLLLIHFTVSLTILQYKFLALHFYACVFSKNCLFSLDTQLSLPWLFLFFSFHSSLRHAAYSCMTFSLGPMIQVLLSCLLHSTQSIYTSSIRPRASLFCRYSTEDKPNVCGCMYVGQV